MTGEERLMGLLVMLVVIGLAIGALTARTDSVRLIGLMLAAGLICVDLVMVWGWATT